MGYNLNFIGENKSAKLISLTILILFFYYIFNEKFRVWYVSIVYALMFAYVFFKNKQIIINIPLIVFCLISFLTFSLSYYLFDRLDVIPQGGPSRTYKNIVNQYLWVIPFCFLPTLYRYSGFKTKHFFNVLYIVISFLLIYSWVIGFQLDFHRGLLADFYNPIISYDIVFVSLSIFTLVVSFYFKSASSYLLTTISLLTLFVFILHGSRGTWLIVPFLLLFLTLFYYKTQKKKLLFSGALLLIFLTVNAIIPNSPVFNRFEDFQNDKAHIENHSYNNSTGSRLVMWRNAIELFQQQPVIGVGVYGVEQEQCHLAEQGILPSCFQHKHNIFFQDLAANGLIGLIGLIISLFTPLIFFFSQFFSKNELVRNLALAGFLFVFSFLLSGLTEYYLFFPHVTYIFFFITASLMSFIILKNRD
ncbi:O-antigen ligase family protein [Acinetobacter sp. ANC 3882]|uniref:O-antigen ligase family protein n=1 Tax=Acinetobacter sp. ANC 3882 TaxID=2923423 RepID=UPI001F4AFDC0|nr:O-antigen ligase family protein [Acinetobacter sp. ANC 3882]MCH7314664.1 O-antigen ligase family protein [Acinetobacter sp. ANC 3882]